MSADLGFPVPPPIAAEAGTSHRMLIYSRLAIMDVWLVFGSLTSQNVIHFGILALAVATFLLSAVDVGYFGHQTTACAEKPKSALEAIQTRLMTRTTPRRSRN